MEGPKTGGERRRYETNRCINFRSHRRPRPKGFQGIRPHPRGTRGDGRRDQGFQGRHHLGDRAMSRPDTPFPKHWRYYIVIKWVVIAAAVVLALKLFGVF